VTFWLNVGLAYLLLLGVGVVVGALWGSRRRRGRGGGGTSEPVAPGPFGPSLVVDCPPLGSAFDRALLPGTFEDDAAGTQTTVSPRSSAVVTTDSVPVISSAPPTS